MYTQSKFPVLEQHFAWYKPCLTINTEPSRPGSFIAGIDLGTGEICVGTIFEFLAYKVQVFIIYKLISFYSDFPASGANETLYAGTSDPTVRAMNEKLPHVDPQFFVRLILVLSVKPSIAPVNKNRNLVYMHFPDPPIHVRIKQAGRSPRRKNQDT